MAEQLSKLPQRKITQVIIVLLLSYIAYLFAQLTWLSLAEPAQQGAFKHNAALPTSARPQRPLSVKAIQSLNLFGAFSQATQPKVEEVVVKDAPETRLKLSLTGVVASSKKETAAAVIESKGKQATYSIGETITGTRAVLEDIFSDRVLIKVSGRLETLMFEGMDFDKNINRIKSTRTQSKNTQATSIRQSSPSPIKTAGRKFSSPHVVDQRNNKALANSTKSLKKELDNDPGKITDYLKISPKRDNGKIAGYRLMPGKDPTFFQSAGLKSGDVDIQMNGFDLTAPREAAQALKSLKEQREVSLLLDRNGDMTEILFSIDN